MSSANRPAKISADHGKQTALSAACFLSFFLPLRPVFIVLNFVLTAYSHNRET